MTGFSVGLMWPGTFSMVARAFPQGGTAMFAMLALAGDVGLFRRAGRRSALSPAARGLNAGLMVACVFPVLMLSSAVSLSLRRHAGK